MTQTQQTILALAIYTIWITLLYIRIFDKTLKKYVLLIGVLLAFWMVVRILKTYTTGFVTEMLWYLYYIPLLLIPTFYYNCSSYLINSKNKKRRIATIIISTILFLLVITNSIHNIVFKIKSNINDYNHNIGYFIIVAWILCLIVVAIINLIKSSKNKGYKNIISISIIILIGVVYTILYIKNVPVIRKTNMSVIIGTLFCVGLEMMLDFNLIPNNFRYKKIFKNSNLPLEIISRDGKTRIATNHPINLKENIINDIKDNKVKNTYKDNNIVKNVEENASLFATNTAIKIINSTTQKENTYKFEGVIKEMYCCGSKIALNLGSEIHFVDTNGWLIKKYTSNQEVRKIVISNEVAGIIYRNKIELIKL